MTDDEHEYDPSCGCQSCWDWLLDKDADMDVEDWFMETNDDQT